MASDHPLSEVDATPHLLGLAARGELGQVGKFYLDLPALAQPWTCASLACTPGRRAAGARSCCADLVLTPEPEERAAIEGILPTLKVDDPRWKHGPPTIFAEDGSLLRPGRRCVFAVDTPEHGLRCALHGTGAKPSSCRLFPLLLLETDDGRTLISAIHRKTASLVGSRPARVFPCLGYEGAPTLAESMAEELETIVGKRSAKALLQQVRDFAG